MKTVVLTEPGPIDQAGLAVLDRPVPEPGPGELLLRVRTCGLCHTDLHTIEGDLDLPQLPLVPGHQIVGTVAETGPETREFDPGDRVGVGWLFETCGQCTFCERGRENLCPEARFTGLHADGGYAEYATVREEYAYPLPEPFSDESAAPLLCAGIIGYRSLRRAEIEPGGRLGLYGFGASAHLAIQVARHWNCAVYVFSRTESHRRLAEELGAAWTGSARTRPPDDLDASVTFAPAGWIVKEALDHLRPGGTLAINAIHMSPVPELPYDRIYHERTLRSVKNFTRSDADEFLRVAGEIPVETTVEEFPLEEARTALRRLKHSEIDGSAVLRIA